MYRRCGRASIEGLIDQDILVFTGFLNDDIHENAVTWPQCIVDMIKVGSRTASGRDGDGIGIGANGINYYADGRQNLAGSNEGNSFASPRAAAYFAVLASEVPESTIGDRINAVSIASARFHTYNGFKNRDLRTPDIEESLSFLRELYPPDIVDPIESGGLAFEDTTEYGPSFGTTDTDVEFEIDLSNTGLELPPITSSLAKNTKLSLTGKRDVELSVSAKFDSGALRRFTVRVNGISVGTLDDYTEALSEKKIIIHKRFFRQGVNTIKLAPFSSSYVWE